jgi:hypothetical protein
VHDPGLDPPGKREAAVAVGGDDLGAQAVGGVVRAGDGCVGAVHLLDGGDGPERLVSRELRAGGDVRDQRRLEAGTRLEHPEAEARAALTGEQPDDLVQSALEDGSRFSNVPPAAASPHSPPISCP